MYSPFHWGLWERGRSNVLKPMIEDSNGYQIPISSLHYLAQKEAKKLAHAFHCVIYIF